MTVELHAVRVWLGHRPVIDRVTSTITAGSWLGLIGPNGSGKTTLLRAVAGLVAHDGRIEIDHRHLAGCSRRELAQLVAYVPQRPTVPGGMSVADFVLLGRTSRLGALGREGRRDRRVVRAVLERLDLGRHTYASLGQLSGGELQRAVLARALAQEAPALLMDEPTSALDLGHSQLVLELVDELRREHGLVVISSMHDLAFATQYSDRLLLLANGHVEAEGPPTEVLTEERVRAVYDANVEVLLGKSGVIVAPARPSSLKLSVLGSKERAAGR